MKKLLSLTLIIIMLFSTISINVSASTTPSDWAVNEVNDAKNAGIITNAITKNYQKDITREEFCELVVKLYEKLTNQNATVGTDIFNDTDNQEILKAYNLGIVKGVSSNQFAPYNNITRQEICVMLVRCIDVAIDGADINNFNNNNFVDKNKISDWAIDCVNYAFDNGIMKGVGNNCIDPLGNTTCEQSILLAYRIFANRNNLVVFDDLEEDDLRDLFSVKDKINTSVKEYTNNDGKIDINSLDTVINKVADVSKELKENNEILDYNKDENTVWLKLNSGLQFVYVPEIEGYDLGGNNISIMTYQPFNSDYGTERPGSRDMERGIEATDGSAQNISNKFGKYSFTQNYDDGQVTLDSLKQIGSNQIILWHGHGGYNSSIHSFLGVGEELDETKFLWDPVYYVKNIKYTGDYLSGRIVCLSSGNIGVTSKFFTKYLPQMSNTFVYLGTCESAHDSVLVDSFINKGATTVIGNSATIYTEYNQKMIKSTCDGLMMKNSNSQYNTILEAQNYAKSLHGNTDGSEYSATPVIYGNQSLRLSHEQDNELQDLVGTYKGSYIQNQGETGLTLTVYEENGQYKAIFDFYNLPGKTNAKSGKYYMNVSYDKNTKDYIFKATEWIERPSNYFLVDLRGKLEDGVLSGNSPTKFRITTIDKYISPSVKLNNLIGTYEGSYFAGQGETGLTLTIYEDDGQYKAIFDFYNLPGKTNAKSGSYYMNVSYDELYDTYSFEAYEWIDRPSSYDYINLKGTYNNGVLSGTSPTKFEIYRSR
ncbi:MAG: S-layer homology domain-containing protein [Oscillospiraceae bacterium]|nr:S-layer homology domain-containing protein [Oscillospiraceae bacterium]